MATTTDRSNCFVLAAFDCTLWCPIAQAPFHVTDVGALRSILSLAADEDPKLERFYPVDDEQITTVVSTFEAFDPRQINGADLEIWLHRCRASSRRLIWCTPVTSFRCYWS